MSGCRGEGSAPVEVFGPVGLRKMLRTNLNLARSQLQFKYMVHELHHDVGPGDYDGMVSSDEFNMGFSIVATNSMVQFHG